jgi:hypothetical protein
VKRLIVEGTEWTYAVGGSGPATLLYLPGGAGGAESGLRYVSNLAHGRQIVTVNYPLAQSMPNLTDGLIAILDANDAATAAVWGPHSEEWPPRSCCGVLPTASSRSC